MAIGIGEETEIVEETAADIEELRESFGEEVEKTIPRLHRRGGSLRSDEH